MQTSALVQTVQHVLWPLGESSLKVWMILDGARDPCISWDLKNSYENYTCLYSGELHPDLERAAPYLVQLDYDAKYTQALLRKGWGQSWGVFFRCAGSLHQLRHHLRTLLLVHDPKGRRLVFRYYDPRVLRIYLPTCTTAELRTVFGPIETFWTESADSNQILQFKFKGGKLIQDATLT